MWKSNGSKMARVNISDVAREAGVSLGTVSNAINHPERVRPETRRLIEEAIERLGITEATAHELFSLHRSIKEELMENELAAKPFAVKALSVLKDHGFALGLATSSYRPVAERELEPFGMQAYFDSITCGDEIEHGKPAPDIYLLAAERLGMRPEECAVVEDSPNGVRAGAAAGMSVFLVPDTIEPTPEIRSMCVDVLGSLDELAGAIRLRNEEIA